MAKCSNCGKEVPQTEGKRQKLYCDEACRMKLKRRASHKIKPLITNINTEQDRQPVRELHVMAAEYAELCRCLVEYRRAVGRWLEQEQTSRS